MKQNIGQLIKKNMKNNRQVTKPMNKYQKMN